MSGKGKQPPRILFVISSETELNLLQETLDEAKKFPCVPEIFCPGPGLFTHIYKLTGLLKSNNYDFILNLGICGSFSETLAPGSLVNVNEDCFADFGAEDETGFLKASTLGLMDPMAYPFNRGLLYNSPGKYDALLRSLPSVRGITVMRVTGSEHTAAMWRRLYQARIESMEGAAFFYVCRMENATFAQVRAVSNDVGKRDRSSWDIPAAMFSLSEFIKDFLSDV
jgi:futalosine hydrolase